MSEQFKAIITESKRRANRTEELFARSISIWEDLEGLIKSTPYTIEDWTEIAKKTEGVKGMFFAAHLEVIKSHLQLAKKRKILERPRATHFNTIPPSRLIKKV
ncbi:MAG: hypothetical protein ACOYK6_00020 [Chthoniobacterales bacterium]